MGACCSGEDAPPRHPPPRRPAATEPIREEQQPVSGLRLASTLQSLAEGDSRNHGNPPSAVSQATAPPVLPDASSLQLTLTELQAPPTPTVDPPRTPEQAPVLEPAVAEAAPISPGGFPGTKESSSGVGSNATPRSRFAWFSASATLEDAVDCCRRAVAAAGDGGCDDVGPVPPAHLPDAVHRLSYLFESEDASVVVQTHAPAVYRWLRAEAGVTAAAWRRAWDTPFAVAPSSGKSGAQFAAPADGLFLLKTLTVEEHKVLRDVLPDLVQHFAGVPNGGSLINRPYGLFTVTVRGKAFHFVALGNVCPPQAPLRCRYDLKGSTHGRKAASGEHRKAVPLLKDRDWLSKGEEATVADVVYARLVAVVRRDCEFLARNELMDYSLYVGVCDGAAAGDAPGTMLVRAAGAAPPASSYYMGIIDYLQVYNVGKRIAHAAKGLISDKESLSTVPPKEYALRFEQFVVQKVLSATAYYEA